MTKDQASKKYRRVIPAQTKLANSYYALLGLHPSASVIEIRRAYRELSKHYHPDTTNLPVAIATAKFQQINEAYATLSNPQRRLLYDHHIGYSRFSVIQAPAEIDKEEKSWSRSAYLDPTDRPLSPGEIFALFILGLTFIGCLLLAIGIGLTRGEAALQVPTVPSSSLKMEQPTPNSKSPHYSFSGITPQQRPTIT